MREMFLSVVTAIGSAISYYIGGVDTMFTVLCIFLVIDYVSGIVVALVFKNSSKTDSGKLNSAICFKGLCKKLYTILLVGVAHLLDTVLETNFIRGGVIFAFISNETISIIENAGLMGIPIPKPLAKAIELLDSKEENNNNV